jgi:Type II CAAX prenyl endopeptidase Rce1-like
MGPYWRITREPRYSVLFALPLLVCYQLLAALQPVGPQGSLRSGADVILQGPFIALAGSRGPLLFLLCLTGLGVWLVAWDIRRHGRPAPRLFPVMVAESAALAVLAGAVVSGLTAHLLGAHPLAIGQVDTLDRGARLMLALGAGLYEELLFRVILVGALAWGGQRILGWTAVTAGAVAVVLGAAIFSAFHYIGPYGDRWQLYSFVYRLFAGLFFSALYVTRGFGVTAWTHALYDVFVLVVRSTT